MKKKAVLLLLLLSGLGLAADYISVNVAYDKNTATPQQQLPFTITVFNPNEHEVDVRLQVTGSENAWATLTKYKLTVDAKSTKDTILYIEPPKDAVADAYAFTVFAFIEGSPKISDKETFTLNVLASEKLKMETEVTARTLTPGEPLLVSTMIENSGTIQYSLLSITYSIVKDGETAWQETKALETLSPNSYISDTYDEVLEALVEPGTYEFHAVLSNKGKEIIRAKDSIRVGTKHEVSVETSTEEEFIRKQITYTIRNTGNVVATKQIIVKPTWLESRFMTSTDPYSRKEGGYVMDVEVLPGQTKTVVVSTYGRVLSLVYLLLLVIAGLLVFIWYRSYTLRPKISLEKTISAVGIGKKHVEISIALILKNLSKEAIENIFITDAIPNNIDMKKFTTLNPSQVNERENEIEYIWTVNKMLPSEERVLVYKLKTLLTDVHLPRASAQARNTVGKLYFARSEPLHFSSE